MQSSRRIHRRSVAFFLAVAVAGLVFGGALLAAGGPTPVEVYPPNATVKGRTVAEWGALWWQWAVAGPKDVNPVADGTGQFCHNGEPEDVVFLAGTFGGPQVTRECTIPGGKEIFFPVLNNLCVVCRTDRPRKNCGELKADCTAQIDAAVELKVTFDGVDIMDPANLFKHREAYPPVGCYQVFIPPNSIAACESKWYEPACHEGIYLMIKPLPPGGPYDLRVYGRKDSPAFTVDVLYKLTVVDVASPPRFFRRGDGTGPPLARSQGHRLRGRPHAGRPRRLYRQLSGVVVGAALSG